MKFREIVRYQFTYQLRRLSTWFFFAALVVVAFLFVRQNYLADTRSDDFYLNGPFVIASVTVFCGLLWAVLAASVAGEIAARDGETGMEPLAYTAPVSKAQYLGGRFVAAFALNALLLLAVPVGILLAVYAPGVDPEVVGPFRPAAFLTAYGFIALPNAFIGTAIQFAWAMFGRRALAGYVGTVVLFFVAYGGMLVLGLFFGRRDLVPLLDVFGHLFITSDLILGWTPIEKSTRLIDLQGPLLWSRLLWIGVALGTLAFTYVRFRREHSTTNARWRLITRRRGPRAPTDPGTDAATTPIALPAAAPTFGLATWTRQTLAIAWTSFAAIATSWTGLLLQIAIAAVVVLVMPGNLENLGTPLLPRTDYLLTLLTAPLTSPMTPWVVTPLLIILYAGELVWRERNAGLADLTDAAPVPEGVLFLGKFLGLGLILVGWMALLALAGVLVQVRLGYENVEIGLYLQVLFGLQLPEYLIFAVLALVVQALAAHKYTGHLAAVVAYASILFAAGLGIEHDLLVYGSAPRWSYSDMRGFSPSLAAWWWFQAYWAAWALLLALLATRLRVRGVESRFAVRVRLARLRLTHATVSAGGLAVGLIVGLGSFIFYNTNVADEYLSAADTVDRRAEYERRYGQYGNLPQPRLTETSLRIDIHPERRAVDIAGSYRLENRGAEPIDSVHVATIPGVETGPIAFDRRASAVLVDSELGHRIYALAEPLQPGDALRLTFAVHANTRSFRDGGRNAAVTENGTSFTNRQWLPAIGYQPARELLPPRQRREHGLTSRPLLPSPDDIEDRQWPSGERVGFEAVIGTDAAQTAVAPGVLRRTWIEGGRRYFHYATDAPIGNEYAVFSGRYDIREDRWQPVPATGPGVAIQIFHHPGHAANLERMLGSVRGALTAYTQRFGPYPYHHVRLIENPARGMGAHAESATIDYGEGFSLFTPGVDRRGIDLPFAVIAHEMAHQWQVGSAPAAGAGLLTESFAWYAALGVVQAEYGGQHLRRLLRFFRQPYPIPPIRQSVPLLEALDRYAVYRKGPFALHALSTYIGQERVDDAFRRLLETHRPGAANLATSLDLYRQLDALTPAPHRGLLHDLFGANILWELQTKRAIATPAADGAWQVTLAVQARKVVVDPAGVETEMPMDDRVQVGVFAPARPGPDFGETLYLQMHRIRSGEQTITVTVPRQPADAGIDPFHLLIETERFDNVEAVEVEKSSR